MNKGDKGGVLVGPEDLDRAVATLGLGGLVAFPTETVYGLGADAANEAAVARIFVAKGRPADHPLIVHIAAADEMRRWARDIPEAAWKLAAHFWPGPLTLILRRAPGLAQAASGGLDTLGLRVPGHALALKLLRAFGGGIAAPSANRFGRISPTRAEHVLAELAGQIDLVIDGGPCAIGLESTILDLSGGPPQVLRPGAISTLALAAIIGPVGVATPGARGGPRVPGALAAHYSPNAPLRLLESSALEAALVQFAALGPVVVLARRPPHTALPVKWVQMPKEAEAFGRELYARLREADVQGCAQILIERPPLSPEWAAVLDRLQRAAAPRSLC